MKNFNYENQPIIFNLSQSSAFLTRWKESYVLSIFKSGSRSDVECYRGVAILPTVAKLFESIVYDTPTDKFKGIISMLQHGFMKGRPAFTNLVDFVNEAWQESHFGVLIFVNHIILRKSLSQRNVLCTRPQDLPWDKVI